MCPRCWHCLYKNAHTLNSGSNDSELWMSTASHSHQTCLLAFALLHLSRQFLVTYRRGARLLGVRALILIRHWFLEYLTLSAYIWSICHEHLFISRPIAAALAAWKYHRSGLRESSNIEVTTENIYHGLCSWNANTLLATSRCSDDTSRQATEKIRQNLSPEERRLSNLIEAPADA